MVSAFAHLNVTFPERSFVIGISMRRTADYHTISTERLSAVGLPDGLVPLIADANLKASGMLELARAVSIYDHLGPPEVRSRLPVSRTPNSALLFAAYGKLCPRYLRIHARCDRSKR